MLYNVYQFMVCVSPWYKDRGSYSCYFRWHDGCGFVLAVSEGGGKKTYSCIFEYNMNFQRCWWFSRSDNYETKRSHLALSYHISWVSAVVSGLRNRWCDHVTEFTICPPHRLSISHYHRSQLCILPNCLYTLGDNWAMHLWLWEPCFDRLITW